MILSVRVEVSSSALASTGGVTELVDVESVRSRGQTLARRSQGESRSMLRAPSGRVWLTVMLAWMVVGPPESAWENLTVPFTTAPFRTQTACTCWPAAYFNKRNDTSIRAHDGVRMRRHANQNQEITRTFRFSSHCVDLLWGRAAGRKGNESPVDGCGTCQLLRICSAESVTVSQGLPSPWRQGLLCVWQGRVP